MHLSQIVFWILAALTALSAVGVVVTQNIVRAATWLLFTLAGVAGLFFLLGADFVGATQLIVYVGGTLVLVVFGVMLTAQGPFVNMRIGPAEWAISTVVGLMFLAVLDLTLYAGFKDFKPTETKSAPSPALAAVVGGGPATLAPPPETADQPAGLVSSVGLGAALLGIESATPDARVTNMPGRARTRRQVSYLLPFEIVSVHLLVVLIGAAYLARAKRRRGTVS
jgi:NADH-quinone oxidoreductase subunit J